MNNNVLFFIPIGTIKCYGQSLNADSKFLFVINFAGQNWYLIAWTDLKCTDHNILLF